MENAGFLKWNTRKGLIWPWGRVGELGVGKGLGETGDLAFWQASGCTWLVLIWLEDSPPPKKMYFQEMVSLFVCSCNLSRLGQTRQ